MLEPRTLSNVVLLRHAEELAHKERALVVELILYLGEIDGRKLYAELGFGSMFAFCTEHLHLSESAAWRRLAVARLLERFPALGDLLREGRLTLTTVTLLKDLFTEENFDDLVERATFRSKREVERIIATLQPRERQREVIRSVPSLAPELSTELHSPAAATPLASSPREIEKPLSETLTRLAMTVGPEFMELLAEAKSLLSHTHPKGTLEEVLGCALEVLVKAKRKQKYAEALRPQRERPAQKPARISAAMRRKVLARYDHCCAFLSPSGKRCCSIFQLEIDHITPKGKGGETVLANLRPLCRIHNQQQADLHFGREFMDRFRRGADRPTEEPTQAELDP